jgi:hypothetical protein
MSIITAMDTNKHIKHIIPSDCKHDDLIMDFRVDPKPRRHSSETARSHFAAFSIEAGQTVFSVRNVFLSNR